MLSNVWIHRAGRQAQDFVDISVEMIHTDLVAWCWNRNQAFLEENMSTIESFTPGMLGEANQRKLALKVADTKTFFLLL